MTHSKLRLNIVTIQEDIFIMFFFKLSSKYQYIQNIKLSNHILNKVHAINPGNLYFVLKSI